MKKILTTLLVMIFANMVNAQFGKNNAIYTAGEVNLGNYVGVDASLNYVYKENYSFKIAYTGVLRKSDNKPKDYVGGLFDSFNSPHSRIENYQIAVGKIYKLNERGTFRYNLSIGVGYTTIRDAENWQKVDKKLFARNYTWDYKEHNTISLIINPKIEFPFTRYYGLTISPMLQVSKDRTYLGIGFGQMIGLLRGKIAKPQTTN